MSSSPPAPSAKLSYIISGIVIVGVLVYYGYIALNTLGLPTLSSDASVAGKKYLPPGQTYVTEIVNGRSYVIPHAKAEVYVLLLDFAEGNATAAVDKRLYDEVAQGQKVRLAYRRLRLTGNIQVLNVQE